MKTGTILFERRIWLALALGVLGWLASGASSSKAAPKPDGARAPMAALSRTLNFDDKTTIGTLTVRDNNDQMISLGRACGKVVVPHAPLFMTATYDLIIHPELLDKLPADAFFAICCRNLQEDCSKLPAHMARFTGARHVEFHNCDVDDNALKKLAPMKSVEYLDLIGTETNFSCLSELRQMSLINTLCLGFNAMDKQNLKYLQDFPHLTVVYLDETQLSDQDLEQIVKIKQLEHLSIAGNLKVTGRGIALLKACKNLKIVDLRELRITVKDILQLHDLPIISMRLPGFSEPDRAKLRAAFPKAGISFDSHEVDNDMRQLFAPLH